MGSVHHSRRLGNWCSTAQCKQFTNLKNGVWVAIINTQAHSLCKFMNKLADPQIQKQIQPYKEVLQRLLKCLFPDVGQQSIQPPVSSPHHQGMGGMGCEPINWPQLCISTAAAAIPGLMTSELFCVQRQLDKYPQAQTTFFKLTILLNVCGLSWEKMEYSTLERNEGGNSIIGERKRESERVREKDMSCHQVHKIN